MQSRLDFQIRALCPACIEHKAEALTALVRTVNKAGWKELSDEVRRTIRVWDMGEYVTVLVWAERMSRRQVVTLKPAQEPPLDPDDEVQLQRMRKKLKEVARPKKSIDQQRRRTRKNALARLRTNVKPISKMLRKARK